MNLTYAMAHPAECSKTWLMHTCGDQKNGFVLTESLLTKCEETRWALTEQVEMVCVNGGSMLSYSMLTEFC